LKITTSRDCTTISSRKTSQTADEITIFTTRKLLNTRYAAITVHLEVKTRNAVIMQLQSNNKL